MHASRTRAKAALMPDLAFPGDLPIRLDDGQARARLRGLMRIAQGKIKPAIRAQIGDVARWHGVSVKAIHNLEERGIAESERGPSGVRFYAVEQQTRIEAALALRELGATVQDIRDFLDILGAGRKQAPAFLADFLHRRRRLLQERLEQIDDTMALLQSELV